MKNQYEIDYQQGYDTANDKWLDRMDKIRAEIDEVYEELDGYDPQSLGTFASRIDEIFDKYKAESEG